MGQANSCLKGELEFIFFNPAKMSLCRFLKVISFKVKKAQTAIFKELVTAIVDILRQ